MIKKNESKQGNLEFSLQWQSKQADHTERVFIPRVNFWRDCFPEQLGEHLADAKPGEVVNICYKAGALVESFDQNKIYTFPRRKLNLERLAEKGVQLRPGRFYPRYTLAGVGFTSGDIRPFRVLENRADQLVVDINHPLHPFPLTVSATFLESLPEKFERGGSCNDICSALCENGPGLQAALESFPTDFLSDQPFVRSNEQQDALFYQEPRFVDHIDSVARQLLTDCYGRFLQPGMKILDLMASCNSHLLPLDDKTAVVGLGLNQQEMEKNPILTDRVVWDLNSNPALPFSEKAFDLVVCTVSVEYLTNPVPVFREIHRVLKSGAPFVVSFSDRWFPPKVIRIWTELHPFERMALVLDFFEKADGFRDLNTETIRGYLKKESDPYFRQRNEADPLFVVWGFTN